MSDEREIAERIRVWYDEPIALDAGHRDRVSAVAFAAARERRSHTGRLLGLAAAALLASVLVGRQWLRGLPAAVSVRFVLRGAPEAGQVALVGDFNGWNLSATPLARASSDPVWAVDVRMRPGRYGYAFVVDGRQWIADPTAPLTPDDFGRPTSVIVVGGGRR